MLTQVVVGQFRQNERVGYINVEKTYIDLYYKDGNIIDEDIYENGVCVEMCEGYESD